MVNRMVVGWTVSLSGAAFVLEMSHAWRTLGGAGRAACLGCGACSQMGEMDDAWDEYIKAEMKARRLAG